jgi:hypothetical protein
MKMMAAEHEGVDGGEKKKNKNKPMHVQAQERAEAPVCSHDQTTILCNIPQFEKKKKKRKKKKRVQDAQTRFGCNGFS